MRIEIRPQRPGEEAAIDDVHRAAFGDHAKAVVDLLALLRADTRPEDAVSLVAASEHGVLGHVLFTPSLLDAPDRLVEVRVLSPIAVRPDVQRRGIGAALIRAGLERLEADGVPIVFLEGPPATYARAGFVAAGPLGFRKPSLRIPDAAFQVRTLSAYEPSMTGTLVYAQAFWRADAVGLRDT